MDNIKNSIVHFLDIIKWSYCCKTNTFFMYKNKNPDIRLRHSWEKLGFFEKHGFF